MGEATRVRFLAGGSVLSLPYFGNYLIDLLATIVKVLVVLVLVTVVDVVNPRLRIDQAMGYFMRVGVSSLAALAFAVIGK